MVKIKVFLTISTGGTVEVRHANTNSFQHRLIIAKDDRILNKKEKLDYSYILKKCEWGSLNSDYIDFKSTCGDLNLDEEVYLIIETRMDDFSCGGAISHEISALSRTLTGIIKKASGYYKCDLKYNACCDINYVCP